MRQSIIILNFHKIGASVHTVTSVHTRLFYDILDLVAERDDTQLTFDDGNASDIEIAIPALKSRGLRGKFFVSIGLLGRKGYMTRQQVREVVDEGMIIGNHGWLHSDWRRLNNLELEKELITARDDLEECCGCAIKSAAIPYGSYDQRVLRKLKSSGYELVYTSDGGPANPSAWLQPRNSLRKDYTPEKIVDLLMMSQKGRANIMHELKRFIKRLR